eukprot:scaffold517_cov119-Cylindrotheca_fusiformis.AAC.24
MIVFIQKLGFLTLFPFSVTLWISIEKTQVHWHDSIDQVPLDGRMTSHSFTTDGQTTDQPSFQGADLQVLFFVCNFYSDQIPDTSGNRASSATVCHDIGSIAGSPNQQIANSGVVTVSMREGALGRGMVQIPPVFRAELYRWWQESTCLGNVQGKLIFAR